ncbi:ABC transporter substrate-binding protein [Hyphomicrobium sp. D-2]|uniref:ABC transporter substrate-binding protein n=1 Tax=Hyphomicrobium sp. D-2 TaxID=3041621 RepID=UPI0024588207|nr:ABC transporter substrate-binding protein [Hyphomicrobium sp. D-2]MDH4982408.1 ABC transporter substrate-binding protein [Hyphomicrobium sp. D-2]
MSLSRRSMLISGAGAAAGLVLGGQPAAGGGPDNGLEVLVPHNAAAILLARLIDNGDLASVAPGISLRTWRSPDELRAAIVAGRTRLFATPTHIPATLFNLGVPVRLMSLLGMGHLSIVTGDTSINAIADLKGKRVLSFFKNDMPDLVFRSVLRMEGLDPDTDLILTYVQSPMEAAHMLAAGKAETAVLSEPPASGSILMAQNMGRTLRRAIDLQQIWLAHRGQRIPMVGLAVDASLPAEMPDLIAALRDGLPRAKTWAFENRAEAGELAARVLGMRPAAFIGALDHSRIEIVSARSAKSELTNFYQTLRELEPRALGGKLPTDDFYLDM